MAYSGTHETTKFAERDSGNVLLVEVVEPDTPPIVKQIHTGTLYWRRVENELKKPGTLQKIQELAEDLDYSNQILLDIKLSGICYANEINEIKRVEEILHSRFLFGHLDISKMLPAPEDENWVNNLPAGIIRETGFRLKELCNPTITGSYSYHYDSNRISPEVASRALMELYVLASEVVQ